MIEITRAEIDGSPVKLISLEIDRDPIFVGATVEMKADPKWSATDSNDHFHATDEDGEWPSLDRVTRSEVDPDDDLEGYGGYEESWWECRICRDRVEPKSIEVSPSGWARYVPGPMRWTARVHLTSTDKIYSYGEPVSFRVLPSPRSDSEMFGTGLISQVSSHPEYLITGVSKLSRRHPDSRAASSAGQASKITLNIQER